MTIMQRLGVLASVVLGVATMIAPAQAQQLTSFTGLFNARNLIG